MRSFLLVVILSCFGFATSVSAQRTQPDTTESGEDLLKMLEDEDNADQQKASRSYTTATFKATRIINGHSVENVAKGVLDFRISHRFGAINQGARNFFGLDNAVT